MKPVKNAYPAIFKYMKLENRNMFKISEPKTLDDTVKPLTNFNCLIGMGALRRPGQSNTTYLIMRIHTVVFNITNWITIYTTLSKINSILDDDNTDNTSPMAARMYKTLGCVNCGITVVAPFLVWRRRKVLRECWQVMLRLDENFETVLGAANQYKKQYIRLTCKIMGICLTMLFVAIWDTLPSWCFIYHFNFKSMLRFWSSALTLHHPISVMLVLDLNFCFFLGYMEKKFRDMNDTLIRLIEKPLTFNSTDKKLFIISEKVLRLTARNRINKNVSAFFINDRNYLLREIRKAYVDLCKLSRKVNAAFGIQNLLSAGISFVMVTGLLYTIYSALSWKDFSTRSRSQVIASFIWTAIYSFKIWMVNHSAWSVSNEAKRTAEVIYDLLNSTMDKGLQNEIQEFGIQMLHNPLRFDACGFFTLDYTFVQGVIGSITTYLVILIQMSNIQ